MPPALAAPALQAFYDAQDEGRGKSPFLTGIIMFIIELNGSFSIAMSSTTGRYISKNGAEFGDVDGFHIPHFQNGHEASMIVRSQYLPSFGASSRSDQL